MSSASLNTRILAIALGTLLTGAVASSALADTKWEKHHPRRDQVNDRLSNQSKRIHHEVKDGDLTHAQAATLRKDDRQVRTEERAMASQNGGHITKLEQKTLNQQQNAISKQIGK